MICKLAIVTIVFFLIIQYSENIRFVIGTMFLIGGFVFSTDSKYFCIDFYDVHCRKVYLLQQRDTNFLFFPIHASTWLRALKRFDFILFYYFYQATLKRICPQTNPYQSSRKIKVSSPNSFRLYPSFIICNNRLNIRNRTPAQNSP